MRDHLTPFVKFAQKKYGIATYGLWDRSARDTLCNRSIPRLPPSVTLTIFDRPLEIRTMIWERALAEPQSGIALEVLIRNRQPNVKYRKNGYVMTRHATASVRFEDFDKFMNLDNYPRQSDYRPYIINRLTLINLLCVNKQLIDELKPVFYHINHFHARSLRQAYQTFRIDLGRINVAQHLRHVSFAWILPDALLADPLLQFLGACGVRRLWTWIMKAWWAGRSLAPAMLQYEQVKQVSGMATLVHEMEKLERIDIQGDWKGFAEYIRQQSAVRLVKYEGVEVVKKVEAGDAGQ